MSTGESMAYVSGGDHIAIPMADQARRPMHGHQTQTPKPKSTFDWDAHTPSCRTCGTKTGRLNRDDQCATCAPPELAPPEPQKVKKQKPTKRKTPKEPKMTMTQTLDRPPVATTPTEVHPSTTEAAGDPFIAAVDTAALFVDRSYQRALDEARVRRMARNYSLALVGILEVSARDDGTYAILDGQHRWALVMTDGINMSHVPCRIHTGLTLPAEAELYHKLNTTRTALRPWDKWLARRAAGDQTVRQIEATLAAHDLITGPQQGSNIVRATRGLETIVELGGTPLLDSTLKTVRRCYPNDQAGLDAIILGGVANVLHYYADQGDGNRLVAALSGIMPRQLVARTSAVREIHKGQLDRLAAHVVVELYNQEPGKKLQPFFERTKPHTKHQTVKVQASKAQKQKIREWAIAQGLVLDHGRCGQTVQAAYYAAHPDAS